MYKFYVFAPRDKTVIRNIIAAASNAGAGNIGKYKGCAFISEGIGTWTADKDANPHIGEVGKLQEIKEVKIEMQFEDKDLENVISAVKKVHPYEEVVIDVVKLETYS